MRTPFLFVIWLLFVTGACKRTQTQEPPPVTHGQPAQVDKPDDTGFDELSSDYYMSDSRVIWQKPDLVLNLLGPLRGKTVADIGAGTGYFAFRIAHAGAKVLAIDIDPRAITWMEAEKSRYPADVQALVETRLATPSNPNLRAGEADVVLMVNTYIYITDRVEYFRNLRSGLRKDARILIIDFKDRQTAIGPPVQERIALSRVREELEEAGYSILRVEEDLLEYQYILMAGI